MKITIIGSGTGIPTIGRSSPSLLLNICGQNILFDSGPGSMRQLVHTGITYHDIDKIFYTHFHTDHTLDLSAFLFAANNPTDKRKKDLSISGPEGISFLYNSFLTIYGKVIQPAEYNVEVNELSSGEYLFTGYKITTAKTLHNEESMGYRIEDLNGKIIVYPGDTDSCESVISLAKNADILLLEASFPDNNKVNGHLTPSIAAQIAQYAGCKKLVFIHMYPECDKVDILKECENKFDGEIIVGQDLMTITI